MRMAKASEVDLHAALTLSTFLEEFEKRAFPVAEGDESHVEFDADNPEHCRRAMRLILDSQRGASLFRVAMGLKVMLAAENRIVDPEVSHLELHPELREAQRVFNSLQPEGLHPATATLVARFAAALAEKLTKAQAKREVADAWAATDWLQECRQQLMHHVQKGDPLDVAAFGAFLWHHGASTTPGAALPTRSPQ